MEASNNSIRNADGLDLSQKGIASLEESAGLSTERGEARTGNVVDHLAESSTFERRLLHGRVASNKQIMRFAACVMSV